MISGGRILAGVLVGIVGLLAFATWNLPEIIAKRWFDKTTAETREFKYTLAERGLIVSSAGSSAMYDYTGLAGYCECPESYLVWLTDSRFLIVPKRSFDTQDLPRVGKVFAGKLEQRR